MPLSDLVQFLGLGRKTGVLRVETPQGCKRLVLEGGLAVFCSSGSPKEYLGQHLLARTNLTEADLEGAFRTQRETGMRLGEVLVGSGLLTEEELDRILRHKVEDSMLELFTWQTGTFEFQETPIGPDDAPVRVRVAWADLVMEGARRADELGRIRRSIPGDHVRLRVHRERFPPGFPRNGGDKRLIDLAEQGLVVSDILPRFHASDFELLSRLATLVGDGLLSVDASAPAPPPRPTADSVLRRATELLHADRAPEAWLLLRDAARDGLDDTALPAALAACESRLRQRFLQEFGDRSALLALKIPLEQLMGKPLDSKEAFLATRITGDWPLSSVVQLCPFEELEALCIIERLLQKGLVQLRLPARA